MSKAVAVTQMVLHNANIPRVLCDHMLGEHHTTRHRMLVGTVVMLCGVLIAKTTGHIHSEVVEVMGDLTGYLVHGVGAVPYVDALVIAVRRSSGD
jgi:hypothetical protein